ncbi:short-chain fatty acyl-CoA regulator family protein [Sneathiella sp.]|jgi:predicted transcriptional regulator/transcriptional regulator with XRE-family HTH domain|uniref:helix-turn-helix domain-containing protein n=1 Tax=Sneathiella sp. TaxID=1964365 RepID=UPI0039E66DEA
MAKTPYIGSRIRKLRKDQKISQMELASELGISASYLNLIEHERRDLTVPLLLRISQILKVDPLIFAAQRDNQLTADLTEVLQDPLFSESNYENTELGAVATEFPELCTHLVDLYKAYKSTQNDLLYLQERLSQDSVLADSSFRLRTLVTSIVTLSEIIHDNNDMQLEQRQEFLDIILKDSGNLADTVNEMLGFMGGSHLAGKELSPSPSDAVMDYIQAKNNYFEEIEQAATRARQFFPKDEALEVNDLSHYITEHHGIEIRYTSKNEQAQETTLFNEEQNTLLISRALPPSTIRFHLALMIGKLNYSDVFDALLSKSPLNNTSARGKGLDALANYFAGACLFPYEDFYNAAENNRYDIELLQQQFGASYEQICHRLTTLQRPEQSGIPFHLIRTDIAGNISKKFSASGLRIPRYGSACPRWVVHHCLLTPGHIVTQISELPDGQRFFSIARTVTKPSLGYAHPKRHYAISIGCDISQAHRLVYSDGMVLSAPRTVMPVGITCRLCDRKNCAHRAAPPPAQPSNISQNSRNISPGIGEW